MYTFTTPSYRVARPGDRFWGRLLDTVHQSVLRESGFYRTVEEPTNEEVAAADQVWLGGYEHIVSNDEADALTAAGYGAFLVLVADDIPPDDGGGTGGGGGTPPSTDPPAFGAGAFGAGPFGS